MKQYTLSNDLVKVQVNEKGAELHSLKKNDHEYVWNADPAFWGRSAPVLFPFVGSLKNKQYRYDGQIFEMGQHGFARDMDFTLEEQTTQKLSFSLKSNEETLKKYPFSFRLMIEYTLQDNHLMVVWKVNNTGHKDMYFSIGGHPGFMCPFNGQGKQTDYAVRFRKSGKALGQFHSQTIGADGLAAKEEKLYSLTKEGILPVTENLFDHDALILAENQADEISLMDSADKPYLTVRFDTPLVGVWSPTKKNAPFICIEPWYGRCDSTDFHGELKDRAYGNMLEPGKTFEGGFEIIAE